MFLKRLGWHFLTIIFREQQFDINIRPTLKDLKSKMAAGDVRS